jgi:hypothetical protein
VKQVGDRVEAVVRRPGKAERPFGTMVSFVGQNVLEVAADAGRRVGEVAALVPVGRAVLPVFEHQRSARVQVVGSARIQHKSEDRR